MSQISDHDPGTRIQLTLNDDALDRITLVWLREGFTVDTGAGGGEAPETSRRVHSRDRKKEPEHGQ